MTALPPDPPTLVCVTPNPAWDVTYGIDRLVPGESLRVRSAVARAGGKGVNVARVARTLGARTHVVAPTGGPLAAPFAEDLAAAGQAATLVAVAGALRQSIAVVPAHPGAGDDGHPTVLNEPGPALTDHEWADLVEGARRAATAGRALGSAVVATVSGSLPPGTTAARFTALLDALHDAGCTVHVDVSGPGLLWAAAAGADLLKPNRAELAEAAGTPDLATGVAALHGHGARTVVVTDGARGLTAHPADGPVATARPGAVVQGNPTGAGDAAMAALAVSTGLPWPRRLALAVATSAAAVLRPVAGEVDPADVARLLGHVAAGTADGTDPTDRTDPAQES
ncbi:1-phosphofructokinase family hexose kinase [Oerskovia flava]|uniref:1-phosphofructokinase family hexose kinase n=1 Tax=Oerskovia flava TaxID=2986422 RepID=UPI00223E96D0|nr:PfkB family carbohydrate kinase [Oerskovia sp. JB1-3-2]